MTPYLFGVDLEDVRLRMPDGARHADRVPAMTERYLAFLARHGARGTFFVVGDVARAHPALIRRIAEAGHEVACHSDRHLALDEQTPDEFRDDLRRNLDGLHAAGVERVEGYRAPYFSLTERTRWAYAVLAEFGFTYSSSVLPARNPLYGWHGFGQDPRTVAGIVEIPMTLVPGLRVPGGGGVYFRVLPWPLLRRFLLRERRAGRAVPGYLHPYDADTEQERFPHPGFSRWSPGNWLMYANRGAVLPRLERVARLGFAMEPYGGYARAHRRAAA